MEVAEAAETFGNQAKQARKTIAPDSEGTPLGQGILSTEQLCTQLCQAHASDNCPRPIAGLKTVSTGWPVHSGRVASRVKLLDT